MDNSLDSFLSSQNISTDEWDMARTDWDLLYAIAIDHIDRSEDLRATASYFASAFQATPGVHSVRWRIKDPEHLLAKIIRKRIEKSEKYESINLDNYNSIITDLIGVRVLHLFKHEYEGIDQAIRAKWNLHESPPIHYIRTGDTTPDNFKKDLFDEKPHPAGYRSIHYVLRTQPTIRENLVEVQVRTIFEEGWSEIDHKIRYPNFSDNPLVVYFLTIFNRMAGSADEMGTFVKNLSLAMSINDLQVAKLTEERDQTLLKMSLLVEELAQAKDTGESYKETIAKLQSDLQQLKTNSDRDATSKSSKWSSSLIDINSISEDIRKTTLSFPSLADIQLNSSEQLIKFAQDISKSTQLQNEIIANTLKHTKSYISKKSSKENEDKDKDK
ncbi:RelA/SpoT domain-containing protein [Pseudomonas putida]|uniref:RelA/SpoT domain-containing protein n=1 Tax=Pseudomonas putida TaxID=303 RepID=UPI003CFD5186